MSLNIIITTIIITIKSYDASISADIAREAVKSCFLPICLVFQTLKMKDDCVKVTKSLK